MRTFVLLSLPLVMAGACNKDRCGSAVGFLDDTPPPAVCSYDDFQLTPSEAVLAASGTPSLDTTDGGTRLLDAGPPSGADAVSELLMRAVGTGPNREPREGAVVEVFLGSARAASLPCPGSAPVTGDGGLDAAAADAGVELPPPAPLAARLLLAGPECKWRSDRWLTCSLGTDGSAAFRLAHNGLRSTQQVAVWACSGQSKTVPANVAVLAASGTPRVVLEQPTESEGVVQALSSVVPLCATQEPTVQSCESSFIARTLKLRFDSSFASNTAMRIALTVTPSPEGGRLAEAFFGVDCRESGGTQSTMVPLSDAQEREGRQVTLCVGPRGARYIVRADPIGFTAESVQTIVSRESEPSYILLRRSLVPPDGGPIGRICAEGFYCTGEPAAAELALVAHGREADAGACADNVPVEEVRTLRASFVMNDGGAGLPCLMRSEQP